MSKGASKLGGTYSTTSVTVQNGRTLTLSSPLIYDKNDKAISKSGRQALTAFEQANAQAAVENVLFTKADGTQVYTNKGGKNSVAHPMYVESQATLMTHNHPRAGKYENVMGGTFSPADIGTLSRPGSTVTTIRASAAEGTYTMSIPATADRLQIWRMKRDYGKYIAQQTKKYNAIDTAKYNDYQAGKCTYGQYKSQCNYSMNDMLLDLHNWLRANKAKYGYTYTLER